MMAAVNNSSHPLSIFLWNANGILNNINELQLTLIENRSDIAMISETHLTQKNFLNIQGCEALRADHPDGSTHRGTVLLVSRRIPHSLFPPHTSDKLQIIATSIVLNLIAISFASAYLPPGCQFPENELTSFIFSLNHTFVIGADLNAKHLNWGSRLPTQEAVPFSGSCPPRTPKLSLRILLHTGLRMLTDTWEFLTSFCQTCQTTSKFKQPTLMILLQTTLQFYCKSIPKPQTSSVLNK